MGFHCAVDPIDPCLLHPSRVAEQVLASALIWTILPPASWSVVGIEDNRDSILESEERSSSGSEGGGVFGNLWADVQIFLSFPQ